MTERLAALLHEEASTLEVPQAPADAVLAQGRGLRRRRRMVTGVVGSVAAVLLLGTTLTAVATWRGDDQVEPADLPAHAAYLERGAWAVGDEVHVGNHVSIVPGTAALSYTSEGVVVFSPPIDEDAQTAVSLVTPEGAVRELRFSGLGELDAKPPVTDPTAPYLAYVREIDAHTRELVVADVTTGEERVVGEPWDTDRGSFDTVRNLSGDLLMYTLNGEPRQVNWRTGEDVGMPATTSLVLGGSTDAYVVSDTSQRTWAVHSLADDALLLEVPFGADPTYTEPRLSVDGTWFAVPTADGMRVYDVESGESVDFRDDRDVVDYGWTPDGHLVGKRYPNQDSEIEVCDPATGDCVPLGLSVSDRLTLVTGTAGQMEK